MTAAQAAAVLGVTRRRVQALIAAGRLVASRREDTFGRFYWWIDAADLEAVSDRKPGRPKSK